MIQEKGFYYRSKKIEINFDKEKIFVVTNIFVDIKKFLQNWIQTENQYKNAKRFFEINEKCLFIKDLFQKSFSEVLMILPEYNINPGAFHTGNVFLSHVTEQEFVLSSTNQKIDFCYSDMLLINLQRLINNNTKESFYFQQPSYNKNNLFIEFKEDITKDVMKNIASKNLFDQEKVDYTCYLKSSRYKEIIEKKGQRFLKKMPDNIEYIVSYVKSLIVKEYLYNCNDFNFDNMFLTIKVKRITRDFLPFECLKIKIDLNLQQVEVFLNERPYFNRTIKKFNDISGISKNDLTNMFFRDILLNLVQGLKNG